MKVDSNIKMWCSKCQASTRAAECNFCIRGLTACAECGYCFACLTRIEQRTEEEEW